MRALSVIHVPEFSGPHNQQLRLRQPLEALGIECVVALPRGPGADRLQVGGLQVVPVSLGRVRANRNLLLHLKFATRFPLDVVRLAQVVRAQQPDVVVLSSLLNPHGALAARACGVPVVWQIVDTRPPLWLRRLAMRMIGRLADVVMPIGNLVSQAHPGTERFGARSFVFAPPVDTVRFSPAAIPRTLFRDELGAEPSTPIVGVVGNLGPMKGHEFLIEAAALVRESVADARFVFAGYRYPNHERYFQGLVHQAEGLGLTVGRDIVFLGARDDIPSVLNGVDILALASVPNSEGMPTVILEAMACGRPVVATDVGSVSEAVVHGSTGYVVPPRDARALAKRLTELLEDPAKRERFGVAGRARIEGSFSLGACASIHQKAFESAVARRGDRRRKAH